MILKNRLRSLIAAFLMTAGLLIGMVSGASAQSPNFVAPIATIITLTELEDLELGQPIVLAGFLKDQYGRPVGEKNIVFSINDVYLGQARTNESGIFLQKVSKEINAGAYEITASFKGAHLLSPTSASTQLSIKPAIIRVQTIPAIGGVPFMLGAQSFFSKEDGSASISITKPGTYRLTVLADQYNNPAQRIEFGRWLEEVYLPYKDVKVPSEGVVQVGLNVFHQVGLTFVDLGNYPVGPQRVSEVTIRSAQGDVFNLESGEPRWLPASRIARRLTGLEETKLLYSVINVTVDGSNVVNQSQQRFYTQPNDTWPINLLLYSLEIKAKDALFGSPLGKEVRLEFPNGQVQTYPIDSTGTAEIHSLARGIYYMELSDTNGLSNRTPIALSRDQEVTSQVITYLDLTIAMSLAILLALGFLLYGRPWLVQYVLKKKLEIPQEKEWATVHDN